VRESVDVAAHAVSRSGVSPLRFVVPFAFALSACGPAKSAPPPPPAAPPAAPLAYEVAARLARDVGPRPAGSPGDARAVGLMVQVLRDLGFANVRAEPVLVPVWRRKAERAELAGDPGPLDVTALGWSVSTPSQGVRAEVVEVASVDEIASRDVKQKIVFCNVRMERQRDGSGYGKTVGVRAKCPLEAEKGGALAALVRSVGTDDSDRPHTGSMRREGAKIPCGALSSRSADRLHNAGKSAPATVSLLLTTETAADAPSANVVAEAPGAHAEARAEVVVLGAHLDSWDLGRGAVDDGAGVGVVVAAARTFLARPADRTVRVVLFAAEESSLAGAKAYAAAHADELARHAAALEIDGGTGRVTELRVLAGAPVVLPTLLGVAPSREPAEGGADVSPLRALGVPILDARQDMTTYFDVHHSAADTVDALDPAALAQATSVVEGLTRFAARSDVRFARVPEDQRLRK